MLYKSFLFIIFTVFVLSATGVFAGDGDSIISAHITNVYDGDTVTAQLYLLPGLIQTTNIRLLGIDTPEMKSKSECEKELAVKAKEFLSDLILDKDVYVTNISRDKYGERIDGYIYLSVIDHKSVSEILIEKNYAIPYDGGKKDHEWCTD